MVYYSYSKNKAALQAVEKKFEKTLKIYLTNCFNYAIIVTVNKANDILKASTV